MQTATLSPPPSATTDHRTVVAVDGLTKRYGAHAAVDGLTFDVPAGHVVGLLGPNGAGKTTAMKMLLGLVEPSAGTATLLGARHGTREFGHAVQRVGALIEAPALYARLTARQNLVLQARALGVSADRGRIDELLDLVDLRDRADDRAGTYSLGMKQRLGIAVGMIGRPELVILDEPANGLDPAGIVENRHLLRRLPEMGTTVLVSSHQLGEVQQACDTLVVMADGRLVTAGTTAEILAAHTSSDFTVTVTGDDLAAATDALIDVAVPIVATDATGAVDPAAVRPGSTDVSITVTAPDGWTGRDLNRVLIDRDVIVEAITRHTVSLEDAFLAMTGPHPSTDNDHPIDENRSES